METLRDKVAIVTGGTSGIGLATAVVLAERGASVALVGRDPERLRNAADRVRCAAGSDDRVKGWSLDVTHWPDMEQMAREVVGTFGRIDILVTAAGSGGSRAKSRGLPFAVVQMPIEEWDEVIDTNLVGTYHSVRAVLPTMTAQRCGEIVIVSSSRGAKRGLPMAAAYSASKHGVNTMAARLADEARPRGIRIQTAMPDVTDTPMLKAVGDLAPQGLLAPERVAVMIAGLIELPRNEMMVEPLLAPLAMPEGED